MAAPRLLPSDQVLADWREEGLTLNQMVDRIEKEMGIKVSRSSVGAALSRAGLTNRVRYTEQIPWNRIRVDHNKAYPLTMLRSLARRKAGLDLDADKNERLDAWLKKLDEEDAVVLYKYSSEEGFYYVRRKPEDGDGYIRRPISSPTLGTTEG